MKGCADEISTNRISNINTDWQARPNSPRQFRPRHDGRLHRLHRHRIRDRASDAFLGKRIQRLHLEPGIFVARTVEHIDAEREIVAGESPRTQDVEVFGADAMPDV